MKYVFSRCLLFLLLLCSGAAFAQKAPADSVYLFCYFKGNGDGLHLAYSQDGYQWEPLKNDSVYVRPTAGRDKLMRDPCIIRGGDGQFHMVWTVSWNEKGIGYASSPDLLHWSEQQYVPVMEHEAEARNTWAPEITYDPARKEYMIYWATTITGRYPLTDTASESKYNHRMYYVTTKDFKNYSKTKLLFDPGFNIIDATIVKEGKRWVMFLKNETRSPLEKNIRVAFATRLTGPYSKPSAPITGNWVEGPTSVKIGNQWVVYFDKYREHAYGAITSTDLKSWTDISDKVSLPKGIRHGSIFKVTKEEFEKLK
ncbi:glycoside hydrolase family 43 protein [Paraflavisolibacter sp. H34]|uniref:glycoside hydrolase family 43 protein n=1 Tax=Huijunlia imazamoxiresistens TaxID=3127457 RepID=UPI0030183411